MKGLDVSDCSTSQESTSVTLRTPEATSMVQLATLVVTERFTNFYGGNTGCIVTERFFRTMNQGEITCRIASLTLPQLSAGSLGRK